MPGDRSKPKATAALVALGYRPRLLGLDLIAAYVGLSPEAFLQAVRRRSFPAPLREGRRRLWDVRAIDAAIDRRSALPSGRDESPEAIMRLIDDDDT